MNTISYKGFIGTVIFSEKDGVFFGKIEGIDGLVNFYIAYCEEEGIPLHKSYSGNLNIRIKPETHSRLALYAKQNGISLNALISKSLDQVILAL